MVGGGMANIFGPGNGPTPRQPRERRFGSTEHLAAEAVVAFVDNELRMSAYMRAADHVSICAECAAEVESQRQARNALRESGEIRVPKHLLSQLSQIPNWGANPAHEAPSPLDAAGFPVLPVSAPREESAGRRNRRRSRG